MVLSLDRIIISFPVFFPPFFPVIFSRKRAVEIAYKEKEAQTLELESISKTSKKSEKDLKSIVLKVESEKKIPSVPVQRTYHDSDWKWKYAIEVNDTAQINLRKYERNMQADIPTLMIELKEKLSPMSKLSKFDFFLCLAVLGQF